MVQQWIHGDRRSTSWRSSSRTIRDSAGWRSSDAIVNNTDRKGGHLPMPDSHVYGVDTG
jgi:hypothetical protein